MGTSDPPFDDPYAPRPPAQGPPHSDPVDPRNAQHEQVGHSGHPTGHTDWKHTAKALLGPFIFIGLLLLKFKSVLLVIKAVPFLFSALSIVASIAAWALVYGWWGGLGFVVLIYIHEIGHVIQIRREGMHASAPMFIPFMGAYVKQSGVQKDALVGARTAIAGPIVGGVGALGALLLWKTTDAPLWQFLANIAFLLNLINLMPVWILDGAHIARVFTVRLWVGILCGIGVYLLVVDTNPILIAVAVVCAVVAFMRYRNPLQPTPDQVGISPAGRTGMAVLFLGTVLSLAWLMELTKLPERSF